jgi:hypothetical protein
VRHRLALSEISRQQNVVRELNLAKNPCPCCGAMQNIYDAARMTTQADMDSFDDTPVVRDLKCVGCDEPLKQNVVFAMGTQWVWEKR